jgi:hypothetical protein
MRNAIILALAVVVIVSVPAAPAAAASVEAVIAACDKMAADKPGSCSYEIKGNGIHGCTGNTCFDCPADGKRQCHAARVKGQTGPVKAGNIGGVLLSPPAPSRGPVTKPAAPMESPAKK